MTADELGQRFADVIRNQGWFAQLANESEEADEADITIAAISGLLGLVVVARAMERLAFLKKLNLDEAMASVPQQVALLARTGRLSKAQFIAHLIIEAGADKTFDIAQPPTAIQ